MKQPYILQTKVPRRDLAWPWVTAFEMRDSYLSCLGPVFN